jgi:hypothetical protein
LASSTSSPTTPAAAALMAQAPDLFATPPDIGQLDVLASKLPG